MVHDLTPDDLRKLNDAALRRRQTNRGESPTTPEEGNA